MGDIFLQLQGVDLTDRRWLTAPVQTPRGQLLTGAWDVLRGTSLLPSAPSYRRAPFERPSQHGESRAQFSPIAPKSHLVVLRFYAVDADPNSPMFGTVPTTPGERIRALQDNMDELFFRTQLGSNGSKGYLELSKTYSVNGSPLYSNVDVVGADEPSYEADYYWADYELILRLPHGTWTGEEQIIEKELPSGESEVLLPMGTSPVWDMKIAMRTIDESRLEIGSTFVNDQDVGFRMAGTINSWWIMDMVTRMSTSAGLGSSPIWSRTLNNALLVEELGRPQGSGLLVNPGVAGSPDRVGLVKVNLVHPCRVIFRYKPRYF